MARGHIHPHGDGKWRVKIYIGTDPVTGVEKRRTEVVAGTRLMAEQRLTAMLSELDAGRDATTGEHTLGYAVDAFLAVKALSCEGSTMAVYRAQAAYLTDRLRNMPVSKVSVEHLELFYAHLAARGAKRTGGPLGGAAVQHVHTFLHGVFELARRRKWVLVNPAADAERPRVHRRRPTPASADHLPELFAAAVEVHSRALATFIRLGISAGARRSELCGLRWRNVDLDAGVVVISEVVVKGEGCWELKPRTKSDVDRAVIIDPGTVAALQCLRDDAVLRALEVEVAYDPFWFVFSDDPLGATWWNPATSTARFRRACVMAGMSPATRLHDLRQLMATHLADQGLPVPALAARLGHSANSTALTLNVYTGRVPETDRRAAEIMGRLLDGRGPG